MDLAAWTPAGDIFHNNNHNTNMEALKVITLVQTMNDLATELGDSARRADERLKSEKMMNEHYMKRASDAESRVAELEEALAKARRGDEHQEAGDDPYHLETLTFTATGAVDTSALDEFLRGGKGNGSGTFMVMTGMPTKVPSTATVSEVRGVGIDEGDTLKVVVEKRDEATLREQAEAEMKARAGNFTGAAWDADRKIPGRVVDPEFLRWATRNGGRVFRLRHPWYFLRRGTILVRDIDGEYFISISDESHMAAGMVDHCSFEAATVENHPDIFEELFADDAGGEGTR